LKPHQTTTAATAAGCVVNRVSNKNEQYGAHENEILVDDKHNIKKGK
jgi:hypothetical protein